VEVVKIQITALSENTFYGRVYLRKEGIEEMDIDARPSDAIALALRYKVPIHVHKDVYEGAAIVVKETGAGEETAASEAAGETEAGHGKTAVPEHPVNPVEKLKEKLQKAIDGERYEEAARLRDELKRLQSGN
jgi:bifunctional DNase/RNase